MADALASGASEGNLMGVQVPPRPLLLLPPTDQLTALLPPSPNQQPADVTSQDVLLRLMMDSVVPVPGRHFWDSSGRWATPVPVPARHFLGVEGLLVGWCHLLCL
jgi:hypothetical protein